MKIEARPTQVTAPLSIATMPTVAGIVHNEQRVVLAVLEDESGQVHLHLELRARTVLDDLSLDVKAVIVSEDILKLPDLRRMSARL